ncbi:MAG: DUF5686 and carboxypeptidase regulatory-like domain-containing protein [Bacteroidota bacterium]|nr:DUF5686 and carboxypeptidase regulatory-like domain-containing protein [Bacteroidota bacterium]
MVFCSINLRFNTARPIKLFPPYYILCILLLMACFNTQAQERFITGRVTIAQSGLPLFSCSVYALNSGNGVITDEDGKFSFAVSGKTDSIAISMIGFKSMVKPLSKAKTQVINFEVEPSAASMQEIVVSVKAKYTKAQRLVKKVIDNKNKNDVFNNSTYQAQVYDKIEVDLKNIPEKIQKNRLLKPLAFAFENMDTTADNQKVLPVYLSESTSDFYYKKNPEKERYDYKAIKSSGIENSSMLTYIDGLYKRINVYENNIKLVDVNFISPVADNALNYYDYHILDTLYFGNHRCIQVQFDPQNFGTNTFKGFMWIADTVYALKSVVMHMDKNANINFVDKFEISQFFEAENQKKFFPEKNILYVDLTVPALKKTGLIAKKTTLYDDAILNNKSIDTAFDKKPVDVTTLVNDTSNWEDIRLEPLSRSENSVYKLMDTLNKIPVVETYSKIISALSDGYYTTGNVDIGNIYSFYTNNTVEGTRVNFGLKTNTGFNRKVQLKGYIGYATTTQKTSYQLRSLFVLNPKAWSTLKLTYSSDLYGTYDNEDELDQNSIFAFFLRRVKSRIKLINREEADVEYRKYFDNGIAIGGDLNKSILTPYFNVYYTHGNFTPYLTTKPDVYNNDYEVNEASLWLRFSHKEKFITQHFRRGSLGSNYPIVTLRYTKGIKVNNGFFKSDFDYSKWNLNIGHDFTDGRIGELSYSIEAGITKGILPIVLLDVQKGNDTYYYNSYAFNNMNRYEFATDKYVALAVEQTFGSFPFRYIPGIRKLKWRSLATFRGVLGDMSPENRIANGYYDTSIDYHFTVPDKIPYMEAGVGIDNIFHLIRIDAIWRLNYLDNPGISKFGIKGSIELKL